MKVLTTLALQQHAPKFGTQDFDAKFRADLGRRNGNPIRDYFESRLLRLSPKLSVRISALPATPPDETDDSTRSHQPSARTVNVTINRGNYYEPAPLEPITNILAGIPGLKFQPGIERPDSGQPAFEWDASHLNPFADNARVQIVGRIETDEQSMF